MSEIRFPERFALGALATWRVTHLLAEEDGPADAVVRLRSRVGDGAIGQAMDCLYCLSVWVAAPLAVGVAPRRRDLGVTWLALSGAACLLERMTAPRDPHEDATREECGELLRPQAAGA